MTTKSVASKAKTSEGGQGKKPTATVVGSTSRSKSMGIGKEAGEGAAAAFNKAPAFAALILATAALTLAITFRVSPSGRYDSFTGTQGKQMEARLEAKGDAREKRLKDGFANEVNDMRREQETFWTQHLSHPHLGVSERLATLEARYTAIQESLHEIKAILNGRK